MHSHRPTKITFPHLSPSLYCAIVLLVVVLLCGGGVCVWRWENFIEEFRGARRWSGGNGAGAIRWSGSGGDVNNWRRSSQGRKQDGEPFNGYKNSSTDINIR
ncbi:hypothetical protein LR48_Vigan05g115900 [Vigna angularis]|uniref:Uncharacterized protein n=1 Tax=Phaseolus angularis TaxID=3914 RepID=A0A0L9ULW8_PHAAN|nr:hypothetical protein LR48_Vigan05g115900 [Vigna angularis]